MTHTHTLSAAAIVLLILYTSSSYASDLEFRSLLEFKKGIETDPLGKIFSTWNKILSNPSQHSSTCPSSFYGVICDQSSTSVVAVHLDGLGLTGKPKLNTLVDLNSLQNLTLSGNFFTGRLGPTFGGFSSLQYLDLSDNQFYGPIPARINDLWSLNLSRNNFTGVFPTGNSNLGQLKVLDLHGNSLWGDVQGLFPDLRNVEYVDLSGNGFYGSLRMTAKNVSSLANTINYLNMSGNKLVDGFFGEDVMALFRNLRVLDVGNNEITGQLPSFANLPNLRVLRLGKNVLYGAIPADLLQGVVPLEELDLSGNGFSGSIPTVNSSTTLINLNLSGNRLTGPIPIEGSHASGLLLLPSYPQLEFLDLSNNTLTGNISSGIGNFASLKLLKLAKNKLSGQLPNELDKLGGLEYLDLSENNFTGDIPKRLSPSLHVFNVSYNNLQGTVPENLRSFTDASYYPGNSLLVLPERGPHNHDVPNEIHDSGKHHSSKSSVRIAIIVACVGAAFMISFVFVAYNRAHLQEFCFQNGLSSQTAGRDIKLGMFSRPSILKFNTSPELPKSSPSFSDDRLLSSPSFSNDHLLSSNPRFLSEPGAPGTGIAERHFASRSGC